MTQESITRSNAGIVAWLFGLLVFSVGIFLDLMLIDVGISRTQTLLLTKAITGIVAGVAIAHSFILSSSAALRRPIASRSWMR